MIRVALKFGAFVVVCLMFTGYLAFTIGNLKVSDPLGHDTYRLTATFDDVTGLLINDNVKVAGVVVGKVTNVATSNGRAIVDMAIDNTHDDIPKQGTCTPAARAGRPSRTATRSARRQRTATTPPRWTSASCSSVWARSSPPSIPTR
jgi:hypothetical protein